MTDVGFERVLLLLMLLTAAWAAWHVAVGRPLPGLLGSRYRQYMMSPGELRIFATGVLLGASGLDLLMLTLLGIRPVPGVITIGLIVLGVALQAALGVRVTIRRVSLPPQLTSPAGIILVTGAALAALVLIAGVALMLWRSS